MNQSNRDKLHVLKEKFITVRDWVMDHTKIVMPLVLIVCVLVTILVAVNANHKDTLEKQAELAAAAVNAEDATNPIVGLNAPEFALEENAYPEVNNIVRTYYDAQAAGDVDTISKLNTYLNDIEKIRVQELSKYVESYPVLNVYTKPGITENSYVAYVYSEVKFKDVEQELPGMQTYYISKNEDTGYFINDGTYDDTVWSYIKDITLQDDVVDLNNKVVVEYNDLLANDTELNEFIAYLKEKINEDVGEILAQAEQPEEPANAEQPADGQDEQVAEAETQAVQENNDPNVIKTVKTTDVVNIRTSDSETADKIDKAQKGQEFKLLEQKGNGWSKVEYNGADGYIKSDYLEVVSEEPVNAEDSSQNNEQDTQPAETNNDTGTDSGTGSQSANGTVSVKESVKIRKSASTSAESLGTAYAGEKLEVLMEQADGWTKVKYKGQTAYVKSDFVE